jgi:hypothetical protein
MGFQGQIQKLKLEEAQHNRRQEVGGRPEAPSGSWWGPRGQRPLKLLDFIGLKICFSINHFYYVFCFVIINGVKLKKMTQNLQIFGLFKI